MSASIGYLRLAGGADTRFVVSAVLRSERLWSVFIPFDPLRGSWCPAKNKTSRPGAAAVCKSTAVAAARHWSLITRRYCFHPPSFRIHPYSLSLFSFTGRRKQKNDGCASRGNSPSPGRDARPPLTTERQ